MAQVFEAFTNAPFPSSEDPGHAAIGLRRRGISKNCCAARRPRSAWPRSGACRRLCEPAARPGQHLQGADGRRCSVAVALPAVFVARNLLRLTVPAIDIVTAIVASLERGASSSSVSRHWSPFTPTPASGSLRARQVTPSSPSSAARRRCGRSSASSRGREVRCSRLAP